MKKTKKKKPNARRDKKTLKIKILLRDNKII